MTGRINQKFPKAPNRRAHLVKMKNGRHRVASGHEHVLRNWIIDLKNWNRACEALFGSKEHDLNARITELEKARSIFDAIADRMTERFGQEAKPAMEALIRNSQRRGTPFALFGSRIDAMGMTPVRIHRGVIPEIVYAFNEEIER